MQDLYLQLGAPGWVVSTGGKLNLADGLALPPRHFTMPLLTAADLSEIYFRFFMVLHDIEFQDVVDAPLNKHSFRCVW